MEVDKIKYCSDNVESIIKSARSFFEGEGDEYNYKFNRIKGLENSGVVRGSCFFIDYGDIQLGGIKAYPDKKLVVERKVLDSPDYFTFQYRQLCASLCSPSEKDIKDNFINPIVSSTYVSLSNITADNNIVKAANNYILYISVRKSLILDMLPDDHLMATIVKRKRYHLYLENSLSLQLLFYSLFNLDYSNSINRKLGYAKAWETIVSTVMLFKDIKLKKNIDEMAVASANRAQSMIMKNLSLNLSVSNIANHLKIDSTYLGNVFNSVFRETIHKFYSRKRLEISARMLLTNNYNISEIAMYMGYVHLGHFSTKFKEYFGLLPKDFCRQYMGCRGVIFNDNKISKYCCSVPEMGYMYSEKLCGNCEPNNISLEK